MERSHHIRIGLLLLFILSGMASWSMPSGGKTGSTTFQNLVYRAYVTDRMSLWESTLETMEFEYNQSPNPALLYDILLAQYGLTGYYLGTKRKDEARDILNKKEKYLEMLEDVPGYTVPSKLFRASLYAYRISLNPLRSVSLGRPSGRLIDEAIDMDDSYPRGYLEKGHMLFYAPAIFGGSKDRSIEYYRQAVDLFEKDMQNNHRWLYLSTLVSLANAYKETGRHDEAITTLEKALEFEPEFRWVRDELLPLLRNGQPK